MTEREHPPIEELIERWRVSPSTSWDDVVGHQPAISRLKELVAKIALAPEERDRLGLRAGSSVLITGSPGCGKTMLAKAFAHALGRTVIAPEIALLDAETIGALYRAVATAGAVIVLDECEALVGDSDWHTTDEAAQRALLFALDGVGRPEAGGPVTVALTTASARQLSGAATRPGRLAPRLALDPPTPAERAILLSRAIQGRPGADTIDQALIVERTQGWTGAEVDGLIEQMMTRSLLLNPPGLRTEVGLQIVADRFVVRDPVAENHRDDLLASRHEGGHALWAHLTWGPGAVGVVDIHERGGSTSLADWVMARRRDSTELRRHAGLGLAGAAAEFLLWGRDGRSTGSESDRAHVTQLLDSCHQVGLPFDEDTIEGGHQSWGSEAMRRARYDAIRLDAVSLWDEVVERLRPHTAAIGRLGDAFLDAPGATISGEDLTAAIEAAVGTHAP